MFKDNAPVIGKCPSCGQILTDRDIHDMTFLGSVRRHYVYVCKKCETIIGFSSHNIIS